MRAITATWFEVKIRYDKMMDNGLLKPVTESYVLDALSFAESEAQIIEEMSAYISGDFKITGIAPATFKEIFFSDLEKDDKWYKSKLEFITIDEKTAKEKKQNIYYLVQANTLQQAVKNIDAVMEKGMIDYNIASVSETKIMDVFEHRTKAKVEQDAKPEYEE